MTLTKLHRPSASPSIPLNEQQNAPAVVEHPLLSTALRHLLLLLLFDLGGLRLDLAGTGERAVNYNLAIAAIAKGAKSKYS